MAATYTLQILDYSSFVKAKSSPNLGWKIWVDKDPIIFFHLPLLLPTLILVHAISFMFSHLSVFFPFPFFFLSLLQFSKYSCLRLGAKYCGYNDECVSY